jgi:cytochrome c553
LTLEHIALITLLRTLLAALFVASAAAQTPPPAQAPLTVPNGLPAWTFNIPDPAQPAVAPITGIVRVPGSNQEYDAAAIAGNVTPPDWFPDEHPAAPRVVTGPAPNACGSCHLMSGQGHPESADIAGLPAEYIIRQMNDFKSAARREETRMGPIARATSDEDVRLAAEFYAALQPMPFVKVLETATPPKTYVSVVARHRVLAPEGGTEPIGHPHHPNSRRPLPDEYPRPALRVHRLRAARRRACRRNAREDGRWRENRALRHMPRRCTQRAR